MAVNDPRPDELTVRAATRGSALARWQTDHVAGRLAAFGVGVEAVVVETRADLRLDVPIWEMGGKGVFVKEVQAEVLAGRARIAVHSGKDLPAVTHPDLVIAAVPPRADPRDVLVGATLAGLPSGARVATGSVRRRSQLSSLRPDLTFEGLRGNIATRLGKIPDGGAILMAAAAIDRLGLTATLAAQAILSEVLEPAVMLPQVAQGALAVECRADDIEMIELLGRLDDLDSRLCFEAERAFLAELGGDCDLPAGALARVERKGDAVRIVVEGLLASLDGHIVLRTRHTAHGPIDAGRTVARHLLDDCGGSALLVL